MNLRQIRYFVRAVEVGNITRAALQLHVAQPALGLQIRQLEEEFGVALISRHSRGISVTSAGQAFYDRCLEALRLLDEAKREAVALGGRRLESVSLGLTPGLIALLGRGLLFSARAEIPDLELSLVEAMSHTLVDAVLREEIDVVLAYEAPERPALLRTAMLDEELLLITPDPADGSGTPPVPLEEVLRRPLVLTGVRDPVRQQLAALAGQHGCGLRPAFEASSVATIRSVIASGAACGIMAYGSAAAEIRQGRLGFRRILGAPLRRTLYLVRCADRPSLRQEAILFSFLARALRAASAELGELVRLLPTLEEAASAPVVAAPDPRQAVAPPARTEPPRARPAEPPGLLPDAVWPAVRPLLPAGPSRARGGRPRLSDRTALAGILFVLRTGQPWHAVPAEFGCCGRTARRRLREWQAGGVWQRVQPLLRQHLPEVTAAQWRSLETATAAPGATPAGPPRHPAGGPVPIR